MDEKVRELLELVFRKCILITTRTEAQVWFSYSPHVNCYSVNYCLKGYRKSATEYIDNVTDINYENLEITSKELDKLWELTGEKNLRKNSKNNLKS